jgi:hypothetical protein
VAKILVKVKTPTEVISFILGRGPLITLWVQVAFGELQHIELGQLYRKRPKGTN